MNTNPEKPERQLLKRFFLFILMISLVPSKAQDVATEHYNQLKYRHIGPVGNRVVSVAGIVGDPLTYYTGAASGGICTTACRVRRSMSPRCATAPRTSPSSSNTSLAVRPATGRQVRKASRVFMVMAPGRGWPPARGVVQPRPVWPVRVRGTPVFTQSYHRTAGDTQAALLFHQYGLERVTSCVSRQ